MKIYENYIEIMEGYAIGTTSLSATEKAWREG